MIVILVLRSKRSAGERDERELRRSSQATVASWLSARVLFVLTTNRPKVPEPAPAARPGRIDQAIEIGLPGEAARLRLVRRYARELAVSEALVAATAKRIGRVSPAFIRELMRRAAQAMFEHGGETAIEPGDLDCAPADMLGAEAAIGFAAEVC